MRIFERFLSDLGPVMDSQRKHCSLSRLSTNPPGQWQTPYASGMAFVPHLPLEIIPVKSCSSMHWPFTRDHP